MRRQFSSGDKGDMSMANLQWTTATLKQVRPLQLQLVFLELTSPVFFFFCVDPSQIGTSDEMQYDDAFTMQVIEQEDVDNFNYVAGMVPFIQKIISDVRDIN